MFGNQKTNFHSSALHRPAHYRSSEVCFFRSLCTYFFLYFASLCIQFVFVVVDRNENENELKDGQNVKMKRECVVIEEICICGTDSILHCLLSCLSFYEHFYKLVMAIYPGFIGSFLWWVDVLLLRSGDYAQLKFAIRSFCLNSQRVKIFWTPFQWPRPSSSRKRTLFFRFSCL